MNRPRILLAALTGLLAAGGCRDGAQADGPGVPSPQAEAEALPGAVGIDTMSPAAPPAAAEASIPAEERAAIESAVREFLRTRSALEDFSVEVDAVAEGHARAMVIPDEQVTDPATVYLRREGGAWRGIVIGTAFAPAEYDSLRIPRSIRPGG